MPLREYTRYTEMYTQMVLVEYINKCYWKNVHWNVYTNGIGRIYTEIYILVTQKNLYWDLKNLYWYAYTNDTG